jgi:SAM-dependent methyltransferase
MFKPRAAYVAALLGSSSGKRIGDIGAGVGLFLEELARLLPEHEYVGIEPSEEMAAYCAGKPFRILPTFLEMVHGYDGTFDFLSACELLEHVYDARAFVEHVFRLLKPGGHFMCTTLNGQGCDILVLGEQSKSVSPPHHLNFFTTYSLPLLLQKAGFSIVEVTTPGELDIDIIEGMIRNEHASCGRFWDYVACKATPECKRDLQELLKKHRLSSHMRVIVRKPV